MKQLRQLASERACSKGPALLKVTIHQPTGRTSTEAAQVSVVTATIRIVNLTVAIVLPDPHRQLRATTRSPPTSLLRRLTQRQASRQHPL